MPVKPYEDYCRGRRQAVLVLEALTPEHSETQRLLTALGKVVSKDIVQDQEYGMDDLGELELELGDEHKHHLVLMRDALAISI